MKWQKFLLSLSLTCLILGSAYAVRAVGFNPLSPQVGTEAQNLTNDVTHQAYNPATNATSLYEIIAQVIALFLGLLGTIFVILIVIAGYNWLTAAGKKEKIEKAQATIRTAIIGLVIIASAYAITYWIFARLPDSQ